MVGYSYKVEVDITKLPENGFVKTNLDKLQRGIAAINGQMLLNIAKVNKIINENEDDDDV
jgi:hypothetical protein